MTFDPRQWNPVAERCCGPLEGTDKEASFRTAAGRAYYSALMRVVRRIADEQGDGVVPEHGVHSWAFRCLRDSGAGVLKRIRRDLQDLQDFRTQADYRLWDECTEFRAEEALRRSQYLIDQKIDRAPASLFRNLPTS